MVNFFYFFKFTKIESKTMKTAIFLFMKKEKTFFRLIKRFIFHLKFEKQNKMT